MRYYLQASRIACCVLSLLRDARPCVTQHCVALRSPAFVLWSIIVGYHQSFSFTLILLIHIKQTIITTAKRGSKLRGKGREGNPNPVTLPTSNCSWNIVGS